MADGDYGFDPEITDVDRSDEEAIALAATVGFDASPQVTADKVSLDGTTLRYSDILASDLKTASTTSAAPPAGGRQPDAGHRLFRRHRDRRHPVRDRGERHPPRHCDRIRQFRRLPADRRPGSSALSDPSRHRRGCAERNRGPCGARGSVHRHGARARRDPPPARQPRRGDDQHRRHQRRRPRPSPRGRRADLRHRRVAAEGADGRLLLVALCRVRPAGDDAAERHDRSQRHDVRRGGADVPEQPRRSDRHHRLFRKRDRQPVATLFPRRRARDAERPTVAPDRRVQPLLDRAAERAHRAESRPAPRLCRVRRRQPRHAAPVHVPADDVRCGPSGWRTASRSSPAACRSTAARRSSAGSAYRATASTRTI